MTIGIITVLFKSDSVIDGFIDSLNAQTYNDFEVIFIENDIDSEVCENTIKKKADFKWQFIRNKSNVGVAHGNNQGIDYFLHREDIEFLHFLNNDIEVEATFLEQHIALLNSHKDMDALAPKMYYYDSGAIWYAGGCISRIKEGPRHYGHNKRDILVGKDLFRVNYAPTCSLLVRTDILRRSNIRMWDELFVYKDDYVFCKELNKAGVRMYYAPKISLRHKVSSSTGGKKSEFSRYYTTRNWVYVMARSRNPMVVVIPFFWLYWIITSKDIEQKALRDAFKMTR